MTQAIVTKFHGPTNTRGSRISAKAFCGKVFVSYDYALSVQENHAAAARALVAKVGWHGRWIAGAHPDTSGYVFVGMHNPDTDFSA